ncbi:FAD/NAD(P)-binding protein [Hoeflea sp. WL0058]|uniref:FAD/NAD(P)-binding protein n=1 Tax=Flavimaribacter sediminis TaxID=2865987 RepID=A0AAE2ZL28_9HYPH|nr:FAD/NAD(P)-binding domain-containing protein [Flavimaribacter sediminis]MBW8636615.1 FAD/NAD(P)-binding protein [Flavimaribacter sediminis]
MGKAGMDDKPAKRIAVVGCGPRGLGALEALAARLSREGSPMSVDVYDPFRMLGAGPNFDPNESEVCRLNIPIRDIEIDPPGLTRCPPFVEWLSDAPDPDDFPQRAELGRYLEMRYADLAELGVFAITHQIMSVERARRDENGWWLLAARKWRGPYAEVLLTLGQPETAPDDQLAEWRRHAETSSGTLAQAYPAKQLQAQGADWAGKTIAIRGFALSAFDILRVLTTAQGGSFDSGRYYRSGREPERILPFSFDGRPPFPKPETEALDARFEPTAQETETFAEAIAQAAAATSQQARDLVDAALTPAVARILRHCGADAGAQAVADWLGTEWEDPGSQEVSGSRETLDDGIAMAEGARAPSIGFAVGQVWRKWQNEFRSGFNPTDTPPETAQTLIGFDEGLKRYSYGPPVASSRELQALIEAGVVSLAFSADPEIALTSAGWTLKKSDNTAEASVMIDSVLPNPDLEAVRSPLLSGLQEDGLLTPFANGYGAHTDADGSLIGKNGQSAPGLCLLGRLALGSVAAADSLHDCFGAASNRWAEGVVDRLG